MLGSLVASLFLVTACFRFWPLPDPGERPDITFNIRGQETIAIEEIQQTKQASKKPPPPAPLPPVIVPDDVYLDEVELDLDNNMLETENPGEETDVRDREATGDENRMVRADSGPKPVRIVQPEYTSEAKRRNVRAEVIVEVLVNEYGRVEDVRVLERYLLNKDMTRKEAVTAVGYGVEQAAISAAERWMFRPAISNGRAVRSYTTLTFSFGV